MTTRSAYIGITTNLFEVLVIAEYPEQSHCQR